MTILVACAACDFEAEEVVRDHEALGVTVLLPSGEHSSVYEWLRQGGHLHAGQCACGGQRCIMEASLESSTT